jgi:Ca2+-transporting ATPase
MIASVLWYRQSSDEALAALGSSVSEGLSPAEAAQRLAEHGPNELAERGQRGPARILWEQVTSIMVLILLAAAALSAVLAKWTEAASILAIIVLFAGLGFAQEYRAERAMAALKQLAVPRARVRRGGTLLEVSARELVPGDVLLLEAGNLVPADVRLLEAASLRIQEAALTGESEPVEKNAAPLNGEHLALGDRRNLAYLGTLVTYGRATALVVATGMRTELGRIATLMQGTSDSLTPLQRRLDQLGKLLAAGGLVAALVVMLIGLVRGEPVTDMFLTAISVAVAVVPEGLPAVVTFTLALGAQRMLRRNALIRRLPAVETLGSVTTICSDKTGTLTENRMTVTVVDLAGHRLDLVETLRHHQPALEQSDRQPPRLLAENAALGLLLAAGALCNDAELRPSPSPGRFETYGDPTEGALLVAAAQLGLSIADLRRQLPRVDELPFDSDRKRMTTLHLLSVGESAVPALSLAAGQANAPYLAFTKGSLDGLLAIASHVWVNDHTEPLEEIWRQRILSAHNALAQAGQRVLAIAFRPVKQFPHNGARARLEGDLVLVGLVGLLDPPRPEVRAAISRSQAAGIRPVMITGDHPLTALTIARDLGLTPRADRSPAGSALVLTGQELDQLSDEALAVQVERVPVFARVSPEHKLRIVRALQARGHVVAMTGDGVNDAPALKQADIGVAMGITGTDVSREAADMVLRDDNFATIVSAVEEGRVIYDNVRRFVKFSVAGNIGKVAVMLAAPLVGINVALLPLQLLWLNLMTDGLLGLGLGVEPAERNVMARPPQSPRAGLFSGGLMAHVLWVGLLLGAVALGFGAWAYHLDLPEWQTMLFTTLAFLQIGQALATRSMRESLFRQGLGSNRLLLAMALLVAGLQALLVSTPLLERFFGITPLTLGEFALSAGLGSLAFIAIELEKWLIRRRG